MGLAWNAARSVLFRFDPEWMHRQAHRAVALLPARAPRAPRALAVEAFGLRFAHPLGLAAGFDKGEAHVGGLFALGFSHVEVGTITPRPQPGNPRPRLFRLPEHRGLINRMGFNNAGAEACAARLRALRSRPGPVGVNVGKNKDTPNERAADDYLACIERLAPLADYVVVNLSSPNTPGLRDLQAREPMQRLVEACAKRIAQVAPGRPLLVKIAPDLAPEGVDDAVDVAISAGAAGLIATNTTLQRPGAVASHPRAAEAGGLSGAPLEPLATAVVRRAYARSGGRLPIVGVGGVMNAGDVLRKIKAGATLVQAYTGFVYGGPRWVTDTCGELAKLMEAQGFARVTDAIGHDHRAGN